MIMSHLPGMARVVGNPLTRRSKAKCGLDIAMCGDECILEVDSVCNIQDERFGDRGEAALTEY